jgi:hypothetical protein
LSRPIRNKWFLALIVLGLAACAKPAAEKPVDKSKWKLTLEIEGKRIELPLEVMYVHLTDDDAYPESFEMKGASVNLVGEFPLALRVGYGEEWANILNKEIKIKNRVRSDYYWIEGPSTITLPGAPQRYISSGSLTVRKVTGKMAGLEGDMTLHGDIILNISVADEIMQVKGTFAVHGVSLG